jgi:tRNA pseudouridine55 synthase
MDVGAGIGEIELRPMILDGILVLDKPRGPTSREACTRAARALGASKAGHGGALDPQATGVLVLCLGRATRLFDALQAGTKEYEAAVALGVATDTLDAAGRVLAERPVPRLDAAAIEAALARFRGEIRQVPPMFSALKRGGRPLHRLAREGVTIEREPRTVTIHALELLSFEASLLRLRVECSKGTYVRSLAADLGETLGCGAHLAALRRTRSGPWTIAEAIALEDLVRDPDSARARVRSLEEASMRLGLGAAGAVERGGPDAREENPAARTAWEG